MSLVTRPALDELRDICQPDATMDRRNGEHWLARRWLRRVSLRITAVLVRTPVKPNQLTALMIVVGLMAAGAAALPGLVWALATAALVLGYFILDLCDGEVARWKNMTSVTGVYLDRVGHYIVEAALLIGYGFRAGGQEVGGWTTLGCLGALFVVLVKSETDLVDTVRTRAGMAAATDDRAELRDNQIGRLRRAASVLRIHQMTGALESAGLLVVVATIDAVAGGLAATQAMVVFLVAVSGVMVILHLASILLSRRLQ